MIFYSHYNEMSGENNISQQAKQCMDLLDEVIEVYTDIRADLHNYRKVFEGGNFLKSLIQSATYELNALYENGAFDYPFYTESRILLDRLFHITVSFLNVNTWLHEFAENKSDICNVVKRSYELLFSDIFLSALMFEEDENSQSPKVFLIDDPIIKQHEMGDFVRVLKFMMDYLDDGFCTNPDDLASMSKLKKVMSDHISIYEKSIVPDVANDAQMLRKRIRAQDDEEDMVAKKRGRK